MVGERAPWARLSLADPILVACSALLWAVSVYLNNEVLFPWPEDEEYVHWVFVPAGIRILLVMLFGWRAVLGVAIGAVPGVLETLPGIGGAMVAAVAVAAGLMPWIAIQIFSAATAVRHPWHDLLWWHLPAIAALAAFANSAVFNSQLILLGFEPPRELPANLLSIMIGDFLGALVLLLAAIAVIRLIRLLGPPASGWR